MFNKFLDNRHNLEDTIFVCDMEWMRIFGTQKREGNLVFLSLKQIPHRFLVIKDRHQSHKFPMLLVSVEKKQERWGGIAETYDLKSKEIHVGQLSKQE